MKKRTVFFGCICAGVFLTSFIHSAIQKQELYRMLGQEINSESYYTTASYDAYTEAVSAAKAVIYNPFRFSKAVKHAQNTFQSAVDGLEKSTQEVYEITYDFALLSNHSVGNDWQKTVTCGGQSLKSGGTVTARGSTSVLLVCTIVELDTVPDTGYATVEVVLRDGMHGSVQIVVEENRGRFKGKTATWEFSFSVVRVARV